MIDTQDNVLNVSYMDQKVILSLQNNIPLIVESGDTWQHVYLTVQPGVQLLLNSCNGSNFTEVSPKDFNGYLSAIIIGENFEGYIQDVIIYTPALPDLHFPSIATFLPQCYCSSNLSTDDESLCIEGTKTSDR